MTVRLHGQDHVSSILAKLDLNNRVQIALLAHDAGLLDESTGQASGAEVIRWAPGAAGKRRRRADGLALHAAPDT